MLRIAFLSSTVLELFAALGVAMVAVRVEFALLGALSRATWGAPLTPFAGYYLLSLAPGYFQLLRDLAAAWHDKAAAEAVMDEIEAWIGETRAEIMGLGQASNGARITGSNHLDRVAVARGDRVIRYPDLTIEAGDRIAVMGPSGSGKTTLLRRLAGLERPVAGAVTVGATALSQATVPGWRAGLGWMPQTPHFLSRSLRQDVAFEGGLDPQALAQAALETVLAGLPAGLDTPLAALRLGLLRGLLDRPHRAVERLRAAAFFNRLTADKDMLDGALVMVPQRHGLISGTVAQNLWLATADADDEALWQALEATCLAGTLRLRGGLDVRLGPRGAGLLGGARRGGWGWRARSCVARPSSSSMNPPRGSPRRPRRG